MKYTANKLSAHKYTHTQTTRKHTASQDMMVAEAEKMTWFVTENTTLGFLLNWPFSMVSTDEARQAPRNLTMKPLAIISLSKEQTLKLHNLILHNLNLHSLHANVTFWHKTDMKDVSGILYTVVKQITNAANTTFLIDNFPKIAD